MTSVERKLDRIIEILTAMGQHAGALPKPKTPKAKTPDVKAQVEASKRDFESMMARRRMAVGSNVPEDEAEEGYENNLPPSGGTMHPDDFWERRRH